MLDFDCVYGYGSWAGTGEGSGCTSGCGFLTLHGYGDDRCGRALSRRCIDVKHTVFLYKERRY